MNWEYKTFKLRAKGFLGGKLDTDDLDREINELGAQGWELAAAFDTSEGYGNTRDAVLIFKRPIN